ncbi:unnamed protein product [Nesidiocoris tenuis]|uniref:Arf-GAP domain-containing protein n=1 Tax=Nesidiocoris tenuis TaxID=355587 RepID=A0A6H5G6T6_9HEMI|nr:unnamed protein product [Nesidiocoris tenuis]
MSRPEKDRQKQIQDKCMSLLTQMLRDEDNKYCVDCDAKGPRWASWNIGIFLCIRCAGIHRNLGVHISKVKSVNLDTWTPEQVVSLQQMGNSRARAVYEANLPDSFRRPQTDSALESFIRAKYETKKYIAEEWVPPPLPKVCNNMNLFFMENDQFRIMGKLIFRSTGTRNWTRKRRKRKRRNEKGKALPVFPFQFQKKIDSNFVGYVGFFNHSPWPGDSEEATTFRSEEEDSFFNQTDLGGGHGGLGFASAGGKMTTDSILALYGKTQSQPQVPTFQGNCSRTQTEQTPLLPSIR